jgi:hypothetical protein
MHRITLLALALTLVACDGSSVTDAGTDASRPAEVGEACDVSSDCVDGASCFDHEGATVSPVCMTDCDLDGVRLCVDDSVCTRAEGPDRPADLGVCYHGGDVAEGSACRNDLECVRGTVCAIEGATQTCRAACSTDNDTCTAGECLPIDGVGTDGFCGEP